MYSRVFSEDIMLESIILTQRQTGVNLRFRQDAKEPELFEALVTHLARFYATRFFDLLKNPSYFGEQPELTEFLLKPAPLEGMEMHRGIPKWGHKVMETFGANQFSTLTNGVLAGYVDMYRGESGCCNLNFAIFDQKETRVNEPLSREHARRFYQYTQHALNPDRAPRKLYLVEFGIDKTEYIENEYRFNNYSERLVRFLQREIAMEIDFPVVFMGEDRVHNAENCVGCTSAPMSWSGQKMAETLYDFIEKVWPDFITNSLTGKEDNRTRTIVYLPLPPHLKTLELALPMFSDREIIRKKAYHQVR